MEIKKEYCIINEQTCLTRTMKVPIKQVELQQTEWGTTVPTEKALQKYCNIIKQTINPNEERIIYEDGNLWFEHIIFKVDTIEKWRLKKQEQIKKQLQNGGLDLQPYHQINIDEYNTIKITGLDATKKNIETIDKIIPIHNWKTTYNDHMGINYLIIEPEVQP